MVALSRERTFPIGLHLEPHQATLVQLCGNRARPEVYALAHAPLPVGPAIDPEERAAETALALKRLVSDHCFRGRQVVSCLGSQDLFVQNVRLPQLPIEEIEKVVRWEAEERLPYSAAEAEIRHLPAGVARQDASARQEVILLACRRNAVEQHVQILEQAGLTPQAVDIEPCAVLRSLAAAEAIGDVTARCAYLNFAAEATTVMFTEGDQILFLKYIAGGGRQWDQAVGRHLELDDAEAARMRAAVTSADTLNPDDEVHCSVIEAIRTLLEGTSAEIELCLRYYKVTFRGKPLGKIIVTGAEASPWLAEFLSDRLGMACELGDPFARLQHPPTTHAAATRPWRWTTAIGLSLR